ncbi:hypothetical protein IAI18_00775 [Acetobacteraceae bacterium H6797]|nr:hypothetical protein [Acetobacteraceae bacterium H6797]
MTFAKRALPALPLLLLAGCGSMPWSAENSRPAAPVDSLTAHRVMGQDPGFQPLQTETGNVWPTAADEAPRNTLGTTTASDALRDIPPYSPSMTTPSSAAPR